MPIIPSPRVRGEGKGEGLVEGKGEGLAPRHPPWSPQNMRGADDRSRTRARRLRRDMTDAESKLWNALRNRQLAGHKFTRQESIGPFFADFCCREKRLIVEADGEQHAESIYDARRDAFLRAQGYRVIRFWNHEILQSLDMVEDTVLAALQGDWPGES